MTLVSVDIETTGLDPTRHEAWEIAVIPVDDEYDPDLRPMHFFMPVTLIGAEEEALEVGQFARYVRPETGFARELLPSCSVEISVEIAICELHAALKGNHLLGASVHFDASFLSELFRREGLNPTPWLHRYLDLGSYAGGHWGYGQPYSSSKMQEAVPNAHPHTAYGDASWNIEVWRRIRNEKVLSNQRGVK